MELNRETCAPGSATCGSCVVGYLPRYPKASNCVISGDAEGCPDCAVFHKLPCDEGSAECGPCQEGYFQYGSSDSCLLAINERIPACKADDYRMEGVACAKKMSANAAETYEDQCMRDKEDGCKWCDGFCIYVDHAMCSVMQENQPDVHFIMGGSECPSLQPVVRTSGSVSAITQSSVRYLCVCIALVAIWL